MAWFRIMIHGQDIAFPVNGVTAIGFYAIRAIRAGSAEEAADKAKALVRRAWNAPEYAGHNTGGLPVLSIKSIEAIDFWCAWRTRNKGHTFYVSD